MYHKGFGKPSLASIFPFLEAVRPEDSPAWHISRARLLGEYIAAWVKFDPSQQAMSFISFPGARISDKMGLTSEDGIAFVLLLLPRTWVIPGIGDKFLPICNDLISSRRPGRKLLTRLHLINFVEVAHLETLTAMMLGNMVLLNCCSLCHAQTIYLLWHCCIDMLVLSTSYMSHLHVIISWAAHLLIS